MKTKKKKATRAKAKSTMSSKELGNFKSLLGTIRQAGSVMKPSTNSPFDLRKAKAGAKATRRKKK